MYDILIIDDELEVTTTLLHILRDEKHYALHAFNIPEDALQFSRETKPDLVICDFLMPQMNGIELLKQIREENPVIPLILITSYAEKEHTIAAINEAQIYYFIEKPFDPENIRLVLRNAFYQLETHRELERKISELERSNVVLRTTQQELIQRERLSTIGKMANQVIHDLKNPMSSIHGYIGLVSRIIKQEQWERKTDILRFCTIMESEINRLVDMIQGIMEYSQDETIVDPEWCTLTDVIEPALNSVIHVFDELDIHIELYLESKRKLHLDVSRITRVLHNLLYNARDAINRNGIIRIRTYDEPEKTVLEVEDNGCGIPPAVIPQIFNPFFTYKKQGGTGLGMAIVKKILQAHHAHIDLKSEEKMGTLFSIQFPA